MTMTPKQLRAKIRKLPVWDYDTRGTWGTWYRSQEEHWRGWLADYDGPGYYNRKDCNRSAEFVYNHINCAKYAVCEIAEAFLLGFRKRELSRLKPPAR